MRKNEKGFGVVEILLVIVVIGMIVAVSLFIIRRRTDKTSNTTTSNSGTATTQTTPKTSDKPATTTPTQKYLTITEWGVKIPVSGDISSAYYALETANGGDGNGAILSTDSLKGVLVCKDNGVGQIVRNTQAEYDNDYNRDFQPGALHQANAVKVGSYYYHFAGLQDYCTSDKTVQAKISVAAKQFYEAIKNIQAE